MPTRTSIQVLWRVFLVSSALISTCLVFVSRPALASPKPPTTTTSAPPTTTTPSSTTTTSPSTTSTTTPESAAAAAAAIAAQQAQARIAAQIITKVSQATAKMDHLQAVYQAALAAASAADATQHGAVAALAKTQARFNLLRKAAADNAVEVYTSSGASNSHDPIAAVFTSPNNAAPTSEYQDIAASRINSQLNALAALTQQRRAAEAVAASSAAKAKKAASDANTALQSAKATQKSLQSALDQISGPLAQEIAQLSGLSADRIAALAKAGQLDIRPGVNNPPAPLPTTAAAISFATDQIGKPYVWGATGPNSYDCSGLVQTSYASAGISLPRVAADQAAATIPIKFKDLAPGDLVFFDVPVGHVGIYIGNGMMIDAPHTGAFVRVESMFWPSISGFGRPT